LADGFQSPLDLNAPAMTRRSFSVAELDAMFEAQILSRDEKIELIDGEIVQMNAQMMPHGVIKFNLAARLLALLPASFRVSVETTVKLDNVTLVDPDILITPRKPVERRYFQNDELLLVIEVADTSLAYDMGIKAKLYARASVEELWVVDVNGSQTWVHREPSEQGYASIVSMPFETELSPLIDGAATVTIGELLT
jgi:Uma2 family endonuclease